MTTTTLRPSRQLPWPWLAFSGLAIAALVAVAGALAVALGAGEEQAQEQAPSPARPGGLITYEVTGRGTFAASATGQQLDSSGHTHTFVRAPGDAARSPDSNGIATVERRPDGVFLNVTWHHRLLAPIQLAGPDAPALVDGGKGIAAAVKGVPLVLAWAPDSKTLAYGSITGDPYVLHLLTAAGVRDIQVAGGYVGELNWSPDGRYLAISTYAIDRKDHTVLIIGAGEMVARRLSDGCHIIWAPDSRYLAIHRDPRAETGAWVLSVDGSDRYPITTDRDAFPLAWTES